MGTFHGDSMSEVLPLAAPPFIRPLAEARPLDTASSAPDTDSVIAPTPVEIVRALAGFGVSAIVAARTVETIPTGVGLGLLSPIGALLLTGPALLVVHQFLGLRAAPREIVALVARAFARSGDLSLALAPALLLFSATSGQAPLVFLLFLLGNGAFTLLGAVLDLSGLEERANPSLVARGQMFFLAVGWAVLAGLIALRIIASSI